MKPGTGITVRYLEYGLSADGWTFGDPLRNWRNQSTTRDALRIARFSAINAHENGQRLVADIGLFFQSKLRDQCRRIGRFGHLFSQPVGLIPFPRVTKEIVDILDSGPGENSLTADTAMFLLKIRQQFLLHIVPGREIGMPSLASERMVAITIPIETGHPKARPRRDHSPIPLSVL